MILQTGEKATLMWNMNDIACVELEVVKKKLKHHLRDFPTVLQESVKDITQAQKTIMDSNHE